MVAQDVLESRELLEQKRKEIREAIKAKANKTPMSEEERARREEISEWRREWLRWMFPQRYNVAQNDTPQDYDEKLSRKLMLCTVIKTATGDDSEVTSLERIMRAVAIDHPFGTKTKNSKELYEEQVREYKKEVRARRLAKLKRFLMGK